MQHRHTHIRTYACIGASFLYALHYCSACPTLHSLLTQLDCCLAFSCVLPFLLVCPVTPSPLLLGCLETCQKCCVLPGHRKGVAGSVCHTGHVLALAVSSDNKFLVSFYYNSMNTHCVGLRLQAGYAVWEANCCLGYMSPWLHERFCYMLT